MIHRMHAPQYGIFALGTAAHAYLELDLHGGAPATCSPPTPGPSPAPGTPT